MGAVVMSGPNAKDPNSEEQRWIARRTRSNLPPAQLHRRDAFIRGLLSGLPKYKAAIAAGVPARSAHKQASIMWAEPYVQEVYCELREALDENELVTRKELLLVAKTIMHDEGENGGSRVSAMSLIAKVMGYEAPTKVQVEGGIMLVPMAASVDEWESHAQESQKLLKADVRS